MVRGGKRRVRPSLTVWAYDSAMGAAAGEVRLKALRERGAVTVHDAITVTWMHGAHEPRIGHLRHETTASAARGSMLGALVGMLVLGPVAGAGVGAGIGALAQRLRGMGIDEQFLEEVRGHLVPGTSALLVLTTDADLDEVRPVIERGLARGDVVLMHAELSDDAPQALHDLVREVAPGLDKDDR